MKIHRQQIETWPLSWRDVDDTIEFWLIVAAFAALLFWAWG